MNPGTCLLRLTRFSPALHGQWYKNWYKLDALLNRLPAIESYPLNGAFQVSKPGMPHRKRSRPLISRP
nr:MAG TPA: hypothetical protein [Caudoviricetes sp.]